MRFLLQGLLVAALLPGFPAFAQIAASVGVYSQNFDSLTNSGAANWTNNLTLPGWYASKASADATNFTLGAGTSSTGGIYSFATNGVNSSTDRALGSVAASSTTYAYGVRFTNNTGASLTNLIIACTGEQWRSGSTTNPQTLAFAYQISSAPITNTYAAAGWTNISALNFVSPNLSALSAALDGNSATNRTVFSNVLLAGVTVPAGSEIFLRWLDVDDTGFDSALAIDDLTVSFGTNATPANTPPFITAQPQDQTVNAGDNATFSVTVTGIPAPAYQWKFNGTNLVNETNATLTLNLVTTNQAGNYFVTITNVAGATNSQTAALTVNPPPPVSTGITLLTYNVKGNGTTNWSTNTAQVQAIGRQLTYLHPDVITFNEIPYTNTYQMPNWVTAFLPGYFLATNSGTDGFIRSVVMSRYPINRSKSWLDGADLKPFGYTNTSSQNADNFTRDLFEAEIAVPNWPLPLHVFTTHLKSTSGTTLADAQAKRAAEAAAITNFLATNFFALYPTHPFTLSGDMNDGDTNTVAIQRLISAPTTLRLANPTNPFSGSINTYSIQASVSERIDYIFPCALLRSNVTSSQVFRTDLLVSFPPNLFSNDDKIASDHLPVLMTFANPYNTPFQFVSIARSNLAVTLKWESQNNRSYSVESSGDLLAWTLFASNLLAVSTNTPFVFSTNNVPEAVKFFRIYRVP